ncbi:uncharacterized protein DS421_10g291980 [Arachis hypogaea]|nr:uncharacterized protein DS421_10g291980 [Arachis hypogaea]
MINSPLSTSITALAVARKGLPRMMDSHDRGRIRIDMRYAGGSNGNSGASKIGNRTKPHIPAYPSKETLLFDDVLGIYPLTHWF